MHYCSEYIILINQRPQYSSVSSIGKIQDPSRKQKLSYLPSLSITHWRILCFLAPSLWACQYWRSQYPKESLFCQETPQGAYWIINYSCCQSFRLLVSRDQLAMSSPSSLSTDCVQQEIDLLLHNEGRKESVWKSNDSLECPLVFPGPIVAKNKHIEQS